MVRYRPGYTLEQILKKNTIIRVPVYIVTEGTAVHIVEAFSIPKSPAVSSLFEQTLID